MLFLTREYDIEGEETKILVEIHEPEFCMGDWVCRTRIKAPGDGEDEFFNSHGVDKLQALCLALRKIHVDLQCLSDEFGKKVTWMGDSRLDLI